MGTAGFSAGDNLEAVPGSGSFAHPPIVLVTRRVATSARVRASLRPVRNPGRTMWRPVGHVIGAATLAAAPMMAAGNRAAAIS